MQQWLDNDNVPQKIVGTESCRVTTGLGPVVRLSCVCQRRIGSASKEYEIWLMLILSTL